MNRFVNRVKEVFSKSQLFSLHHRIWNVLSHNFGLKILSLLVAILLWNSIISLNTNITRTKTISGLSGYISGLSNLSTSYDLALLTDPSEKLSNISVTVEVPQSEYSYVSSDNVQVTLDLTRVRSPGTVEVALKATTNYGHVVRISPSSLTLTFESMDSRQVPVNIKTVGGEDSSMWYSVSRINPSTLTISGAASVVRSIAYAYAYVDVDNKNRPFTTAERYVLLDSSGNEIPQTMLNRSASSISLRVDVYPTREIPVSTDIADVVTGQLAPGYVIEGVTIQPDTVTVAADEDLLNSLSELHVEPVSVNGLSQSFTTRAKVSTLSSFRSISAEEVYVNVIIAEETIGAWIVPSSVSFINKSENLTVTWNNEDIRVYISGPRSLVEKLEEIGYMATVDLSGLSAGEYELPIFFPTETYSGLAFTPESDVVKVSLAWAGTSD